MSIKIDSYQQVYNQKALEKNISANFGRQYQQCSISVMDTIADPDITFDEKGISNYYYEYIKVEKEKCLKGKDGLKKQKLLIRGRLKNILRELRGEKREDVFIRRIL